MLNQEFSQVRDFHFICAAKTQGEPHTRVSLCVILWFRAYVWRDRDFVSNVDTW